MRRLDPTHASLSGSILPENTATPPAEGNRRTLREAVEALGTEVLPHSNDEPLWMLTPSADDLREDYDRTFGDWLDDDGFEPDWHEDPNTAEVERSLRAATALLTRQADACAELGLLPAGYYGEDCDFEEFFTPEAVLATALGAPEYGCLDDTQGQPLAGFLTEAVDATVTELARAFDHRLPLSARLRFRLMKACRAELTLLHAELFAAAGQVVA